MPLPYTQQLSFFPVVIGLLIIVKGLLLLFMPLKTLNRWIGNFYKNKLYVRVSGLIGLFIGALLIYFEYV